MAAQKVVNLALQGGGTHGAFTWGVLDRLLEDGRLAVEGISGTSAGAINGAVFVQGFHQGGAARARDALDRFWRRIAELGWMSPVHRGPVERLQGSWNLDASPSAVWLDQLGRVLSPYQTNPLGLSPLRILLAETIDEATLQAADAIKLYVAATRVRDGKVRIFERHEVTVDALLASACLPQLFQAVEIAGEAYWDGGYMGNPAIWPLIYGCAAHDIVIVEVNPLTREGVPKTAAEIMNRLNEITFTASLMREMRAIAFVNSLLETGQAHGPGVERLKRLHIHLVEAEEAMEALGVASKLNTDLDFLLYLKELGRDTAKQWLDANFAALGQRSSVDIRTLFL